MANPPRSALFREISRVFGSSSCSSASDGDLLEHFVRQHDQSAFSVLLERYGPVVWHVGLRILGNRQDAEDIFQATFLLLARKAASIRKRDSIASWLHGVAYRLAVQLRRRSARRRRLEKQAAAQVFAKPGMDSAWRELLAILDRELACLPEHYRTPLVLCYLEGRSHEETATALGWSTGQVRSRVARARTALRRRLSRAGVKLTAYAFATVLVVARLEAAVPTALQRVTLQAALQTVAGNLVTGLVSERAYSLFHGALHSMFISKIKMGLISFLAVAVTALACFTAMVSARAKLETQQSERPGERGASESKSSADSKTATAEDSLGDELPPVAIARLGTARLMPTRQDQGQPIFSPDGKALIMNGGYGILTFWDTSDGKFLRRLTPLEPAEGKPQRTLNAFTADGKSLAILGDDKILRFQDIASGKEVRKVEIGLDALALALVPAPNGKFVAIPEKGGAVGLWDTESGKALPRLEGHALEVECTVFSADSKSVFTGSSDHTLRRWDVATGKTQMEYEGHGARIFAVALAPDSKTLASVSFDDTVRLWDVATGKEIRSLPLTQRTKGCVNWSLAFADDGKKLILGTTFSVIVWDTATGKEVWSKTTRGHEPVPNIISPDGRLLAWFLYGQRVRLYDSSSGKEVLEFAGHSAPVRVVAFAADGKLVATGGDDNAIHLWRLPGGKEQGTLRAHVAGVGHLAFSPDGKLLASASHELADTTVCIWNVDTSKVQHYCRGLPAPVTGLAFLDGGKTLLTTTANGTATFWDCQTGKRKRELKDLGVFVCPFPDGKSLASIDTATIGQLGNANGGGNKGSGAFGNFDSRLIGLKVTDIATGDTVIHLKPAEEAPAPAPAPADAVRRAPFDVLTFTRQGTLLVTSFGSRDLVFWDPQTGKRVRKVLPALSDEEKATLLPGLRISPAFSPDGRFVATLGALNRVAVYETASGIQRRLLPAAQGDISSVQFSVDGRSLATASTDGTVLIWDMTATPAANETHDEVKLQDLWDDLAANDGAKVDRAILRLARLGKEALAFLRERMQADSRANAGKEIDKLIADLDGDDFEVRTRAHEELIKQGMKAKPALQRALTNDPSLELQKRLEELLKKLEDQPPLPEESRRLRVVEVLERSGSPEAIEFLRELAKGPKGHPLTVDAAAALARLGH